MLAQTAFEAVRWSLVGILPPSTVVLHVGATAVSGCLTKGDLDIAIRVSQADFASTDVILADRFARNIGSVRTSEFSAFEDRAHALPVGIQLAVRGSSFDFFHSFTDALREDSELVLRYNNLKLAHRGKPMIDYRVAKDAFITEVLRTRALRGSHRDEDLA